MYLPGRAETRRRVNAAVVNAESYAFASHARTKPGDPFDLTEKGKRKKGGALSPHRRPFPDRVRLSSRESRSFAFELPVPQSVIRQQPAKRRSRNRDQFH